MSLFSWFKTKKEQETKIENIIDEDPANKETSSDISSSTEYDSDSKDEVEISQNTIIQLEKLDLDSQDAESPSLESQQFSIDDDSSMNDDDSSVSLIEDSPVNDDESLMNDDDSSVSLIEDSSVNDDNSEEFITHEIAKKIAHGENNEVQEIDWNSKIKEWGQEYKYDDSYDKLLNTYDNFISESLQEQDKMWRQNKLYNTTNTNVSKLFNTREGFLDIKIGPMFSGKTISILLKLSQMADLGYKTLFINHGDDVRDVESQSDCVTTHNSTYSNLSDKIERTKVYSLSDVNVSGYDYIGVDELQFFTDAYINIVDWITEHGKYVIVASLDGDSSKNRMGQVLDLIPYADKVEKLHAYCDICRDSHNKLKAAPFTGRLVKDENSKLVGGKNVYRAMCRDCHDFHVNVVMKCN